mgnify:CR=1 FL=1
MVFKKFWRDIKRTFIFWIPIRNPPKWVWKVYNNWERKLQTHPYDMTKHFVGKNYIYKVFCETIEQGRVELHWYRKKRIR